MSKRRLEISTVRYFRVDLSEARQNAPPARSAPVVVLPPTNASRRSQPRAFPRIPTRPLPASPPVHVSVLPVPPVPDPSQSIAPRTAPARSAPVVVLPPTNASRRSQPRAFPRIPTRPPPTPIGGGAYAHGGPGGMHALRRQRTAISTAFSFGGGPCPGWGPRAGLGAAGVGSALGGYSYRCLAA